jgi:hypothetical protein
MPPRPNCGIMLIRSSNRRRTLAVDEVLQDKSSIGTLFIINSNGTFFVESKKDTNRNDMGYVNYEKLYGVDGVGLANVISTAKDVERRGGRKQPKMTIIFDDGMSLCFCHRLI